MPVKANKEPVVSAVPPPKVKAVPVVVAQFQTMVLVPLAMPPWLPLAAEMLLIATPEATQVPPVTQTVPLASGNVKVFKEVVGPVTAKKPLPVPPLPPPKSPDTSAVAKSTALLVEPLPINIEAVSVSETSASWISLAWKVVVEPNATVPLKVFAPAKVWVPVVTTPASVAEAGPTVSVMSSGLGAVFKVHVIAGAVPVAVLSLKLASVAALALTVMLSPDPPPAAAQVKLPLPSFVSMVLAEP